MKLSTPKNSTFWVAVGLAVVGTVIYFLHGINMLVSKWYSPLGFGLVLVAFVLLILGLFFAGF